jgi:hypothetical protein
MGVVTHTRHSLYREREREKEREREGRDRQRDRETVRQSGRHAGTQARRHAGRLLSLKHSQEELVESARPHSQQEDHFRTIINYLVKGVRANQFVGKFSFEV